jgi:hypothetical protein
MTLSPTSIGPLFANCDREVSNITRTCVKHQPKLMYRIS